MKKVFKLVTYLLVLTITVTNFSFVPSVRASSGIMKKIYVDYGAAQTGDGKIDSPFKTIIEARDYIRTINEDMTGDIIVYLREGTHYMSEPLVLTMRTVQVMDMKLYINPIPEKRHRFQEQKQHLNLPTVTPTEYGKQALKKIYIQYL